MTDLWRHLVAAYDRIGFRRGCAWLASMFDIDLEDLDDE